jgi:hypothetical protein
MPLRGYGGSGPAFEPLLTRELLVAPAPTRLLDELLSAPILLPTDHILRGRLADLLERATRAGIRHHEDRVELIEVQAIVQALVPGVD